MENKVVCTSGINHLCFWQIYENTVKPIKEVKNLNTTTDNFIDHEWIKGSSYLVAAITDKNEIYILEGLPESGKKFKEDIDLTQRIVKFSIKQHILDCFNKSSINAKCIKSFSKGLIIGSSQGELLFIEKVDQPEQLYQSIRYTKRGKNNYIIYR